MGKKVLSTNYRVVIEPRRLGNFGSVSCSDSLIERDEEKRQKLYLERCEEIAADVKRHVDNVGSVYIDSDDASVCEHCGWAWTEDGNTYNGGCCDEDEKNKPATA